MRDDREDVHHRIGRLEDRVGALERFQAWATGVGVGAGAILGLIVEALKKKLGL